VLYKGAKVEIEVQAFAPEVDVSRA
jgi:hypothetical protein